MDRSGVDWPLPRDADCVVVSDMGPRPLSTDARRLLDGANFGHLSTLMPSGEPKVDPVWVGHDGDHVLVTTDAKSIKATNAAHDPRVALSVVAFDDPYDQLLVRGHVVEIRPDEELSVLDAMSQKYLGTAVPPPQVVDPRGARHRAEGRAGAIAHRCATPRRPDESR